MVGWRQQGARPKVTSQSRSAVVGGASRERSRWATALAMAALETVNSDVLGVEHG
jgi:hypothetical protein